MTLAQQDAGSRADSITIPRPRVPFGPQGVQPEVADAAYLHRAARDLEKHYRPFGSNLRATVVKLIHDAADAIASGGASSTPDYRVCVDESDPRDSVVVVDPDGRAWRIHREDADPEHRFTAYRLAAGWFGNLPRGPAMKVEDPEEWRIDALCAETDPEAFFPEDGNVAAAKSVCARCDVREDCLAYALKHNERFGVWGGLSANERSKLLRGRSEKPRTPVRAAKDLRDERIRSLAEDDVDVPTIAVEAGVTERTVHRVLRRHRQDLEAAFSA